MEASVWLWQGEPRPSAGNITDSCQERSLLPVARLRAVLGIALGAAWLTVCAAVGVIAGESALHPARREVTRQDESSAVVLAEELHNLHSSGPDESASQLKKRHHPRASRQKSGPHHAFVRGRADNRAGMLGPADMLLQQGYGVLLPDARAHGASGGAIAIYGIVERDDIRSWFERVRQEQGVRCIDAIGDSMGAA